MKWHFDPEYDYEEEQDDLEEVEVEDPLLQSIDSNNNNDYDEEEPQVFPSQRVQTPPTQAIRPILKRPSSSDQMVPYMQNYMNDSQQNVLEQVHISKHQHPRRTIAPQDQNFEAVKAEAPMKTVQPPQSNSFEKDMKNLTSVSYYFV